MSQPYFIVVLAHSLHGKLRRIHIPYHFFYLVLALAVFGAMSLAGLASSYFRMAWKVSNYNHLREEFNTLRTRYQRLERESRQQDTQLASLQLLATEVSVAYGLKEDKGTSTVKASESALIPTVAETLDEYNFLKSANLSRLSRRSGALFQTVMLPSIWPVDGRLMSHFGRRDDPFSHHRAMHTGVDISASTGTPVKASADGIVATAEWAGDYGRLVTVEHGEGFETYYAHLSRLQVVPGQTVRRGDTLGLSGSTGRSTAPHLHYEVRRGGLPINPHPYLRFSLAQLSSPAQDYGF